MKACSSVASIAVVGQLRRRPGRPGCRSAAGPSRSSTSTPSRPTRSTEYRGRNGIPSVRRRTSSASTGSLSSQCSRTHLGAVADHEPEPALSAPPAAWSVGLLGGSGRVDGAPGAQRALDWRQRRRAVSADSSVAGPSSSAGAGRRRRAPRPSGPSTGSISATGQDQASTRAPPTPRRWSSETDVAQPLDVDAQPAPGGDARSESRRGPPRRCAANSVGLEVVAERGVLHPVLALPGELVDVGARAGLDLPVLGARLAGGQQVRGAQRACRRSGSTEHRSARCCWWRPSAGSRHCRWSLSHCAQAFSHRRHRAFSSSTSEPLRSTRGVPTTARRAVLPPRSGEQSDWHQFSRVRHDVSEAETRVPAITRTRSRT